MITETFYMKYFFFKLNLPGCSYWSSLPSSYLLQTVYFVFFVAIFQFGWAATQISHLSMIPALSSSTSERAQLTSMRYGATVISTIAVYVMIGQCKS